MQCYLALFGAQGRNGASVGNQQVRPASGKSTVQALSRVFYWTLPRTGQLGHVASPDLGTVAEMLNGSLSFYLGKNRRALIEISVDR